MYGSRLEQKYEAIATETNQRVNKAAIALKSSGDSALQSALREVCAAGIKKISSGLEKDLIAAMRDVDGKKQDAAVAEVFELAHIAVNQMLTILNAKKEKSWVSAMTEGGE